MSFDLVVWLGDGRDAVAKYGRLRARPRDAVEPSPPVAAFYRELTERYPELTSLSDEEIENGVWSAGLCVWPDAMSMTAVWPRAEEVYGFVVELAERHKLVVFEPQNEVVREPAPKLPLSMCNGSLVDVSEPAAIREMLGTLSTGNWYATLDRGGERYIQVGIGRMAGADGDLYALERRDGSADRHFRADTDDLEKVIAAFVGFAVDTGASWDAFAWRKVEL